jgi:type IV pilus assembly protein PilX
MDGRARTFRQVRPARKTAGAVLIVALVLLLVLTVIGVAGIQNTVMEERMAGNYRDRFTAFQAAEAALRQGEQDIADIATLLEMEAGGDAEGYFEVDETVTGSREPFEDDNYLRSVTVSTLNGVVSAPLYYIEKLPKVPLPNSSQVVGFQSTPNDVQYYRVTGRGVGVSEKAEVILQSTYHR